MEARRAPRKKGQGEERSDFLRGFGGALVLWCFGIRLWQLSCGIRMWRLKVVWYMDVAIQSGVIYGSGDLRWFGIRVEQFLVARYTGLAILWSLGSVFGGTRVFDVGHGEKEEWLAMVLDVQRVLYVIETTVFARLIASSK
jgi:hypothetical protein